MPKWDRVAQIPAMKRPLIDQPRIVDMNTYLVCVIRSRNGRLATNRAPLFLWRWSWWRRYQRFVLHSRTLVSRKCQWRIKGILCKMEAYQTISFLSSRAGVNIPRRRHESSFWQKEVATMMMRRFWTAGGALLHHSICQYRGILWLIGCVTSTCMDSGMDTCSRESGFVIRTAENVSLPIGINGSIPLKQGSLHYGFRMSGYTGNVQQSKQ